MEIINSNINAKTKERNSVKTVINKKKKKKFSYVSCHVAQIRLINKKGGSLHPTLGIVGLTCLDSLRCNTTLPKQISLATPIKATNYRGCQFLLCTRLVHESIVLIINSGHHS